ncbi:MAG: hypothetical protein NXI27_11345 [Alphaproteobacteria bacterium]|nr:hypothetical protein [Alphaproteobacteria bacterium]
MAPAILLILFIFLLGYLSNRIARAKGRNPWAWTIATVMLGFPLLVLLILPSTRPDGPSQAQNV